MAMNKIQDGQFLALTLAAAAASGDLLVSGKIVGVAQTAGATGDTVAIDTQGVYLLPKVPADDLALGATVYAKTDGTVTSTASGNVKCGYVVEAAAASTAEAKVRLIPNC